MDIDEKQLKDEQELAKVLAGINAEKTLPATPKPAVNNPAQTKNNEEDPEEALKSIAGAKLPNNNTPPINQSQQEQSASQNQATTPNTTNGNASNLEAVLRNAVNDLRPLMDKLNIPADEKFDTYLLLIRSTDDISLIPPAYQTAKQITDEGKRATALLNIIKEINYFNSKKSGR